MEQSQRDTKHCNGCGYILDHLPENRCPECGRTFDLDNPATFRWASTPIGEGYLRAALTGVGLICPALLLSMVFNNLFENKGVWILASCLLELVLVIGYAIECFVLVEAGITLYRTRRLMGSRRPLLLALVITFIFAICCPAGLLLPSLKL